MVKEVKVVGISMNLYSGVIFLIKLGLASISVVLLLLAIFGTGAAFYLVLL